MPIKASARKALRQNVKRRAENIVWKTRLKRLIKDYRKLLDAQKKDEAKKLLSEIYKVADKMAKKGRAKTNKARRIKSRLTKAGART